MRCCHLEFRLYLSPDCGLRYNVTSAKYYSFLIMYEFQNDRIHRRDSRRTEMIPSNGIQVYFPLSYFIQEGSLMAHIKLDISHHSLQPLIIMLRQLHLLRRHIYHACTSLSCDRPSSTGGRLNNVEYSFFLFLTVKKNRYEIYYHVNYMYSTWYLM